MTSTKLYTVIYVVLFVFATVQVAIEGLSGIGYEIIVAGILLLSVIKAVLVAGYYQHLLYEPRSVVYVVASGLVTAIALTFAASYSIT
ncbi:cytochrome C oxidase subunit IV family protein [Halocatena salina]|uniref:Cytochrome C oxidase subunit IV family protein n=1 Tax=Halocatena salina TaxID=2934340 RepID=A0A8U0A0E2_9EURY|nr:cytochrome C oxidase subunit IV family protein [Halocatena salina]UPM42555.1 cytochrome C oxidase subunit IV family protein [Halocatena salina]